MLAKKIGHKPINSGIDRLRELRTLADRLHPKFEAARITVKDLEQTAKKVIFGENSPSR